MHMCTHMYVHMHMHMHTHMHTHMLMHTHAHAHVRTRTCAYVMTSKFSLPPCTFQYPSFMSFNFLLCAGYTALGFCAAQMGSYMLKRRNTREAVRMAVTIAVLTCALWAAHFWADVHIDLVSRQQANLAYVLWVLAMFCTLIWPMALVDMFVRTLGREAPALQAISRNPLVYFLVGNLSDGVVTAILGRDTPQLIAIFGLYLDTLVLVGLVYYMHTRNITIKLLR